MIIELVNTGLKVAILVMEKDLRKPVDQMTEAEMVAARKKIKIEDTDELILPGQPPVKD